MRVTVLFFGVLKDLVAIDGDALELPEGETVAGLVHQLRESASKQSDVWSALAVAVNREYASAARVLREGDEVALLPPVSGGFETEGTRTE
jgi:molybdopterin converting factor subunit 1